MNIMDISGKLTAEKEREEAKSSQDAVAELRTAALGTNKGTSDVRGSGLLTAGGDPVAGAKTATPDNRNATVGSVIRQVKDAQRTAKATTGKADPNLPSASSLSGAFAENGISPTTPVENTASTSSTSSATSTTTETGPKTRKKKSAADAFAGFDAGPMMSANNLKDLALVGAAAALVAIGLQ